MSLNVKKYVSLSPRIARAHSRETFVIRPLFDFIRFEGEYDVAVIPRRRFWSGDRLSPFETFTVTAAEGRLEFSWELQDEQEYIIRAAPRQCGTKSQVVAASVYALEPDLYGKMAVKGDLHMHTTHSDGLESPEHRLAEARKKGFDMVAVTDHNSYSGSLRTIRVLEMIPNNMVALHGEEVHAGFCPVHILSLGAREAVAPQVRYDRPEAMTRLQGLMDRYGPELPADVDLRAFAAAMDAFDRIRESGGLSVLCHIYWDAFVSESRSRMGAPEQLIDELVKRRPFQAFEVTSGAPAGDTCANYLQEAYYRERLPAGFPVIGVTDSHTSDEALGSILGKNYTVAFTEAFSEEAVLDAIRNGRAVSVDAVTGDPVCHGPLRLCQLVTFLLAEYFPVHDETVALEGAVMERVLRGGHELLPFLEELCRGSVETLRAEWGALVPTRRDH